jgi:large conductance mechanosensitive channel
MSTNNSPNFGGVSKYAKDTLGGFRTFILRGNVVDLAIGIVIGTAFTAVVTAFVSDIITPLIPVGNSNLSAWIITLPDHAILKVGLFVNAVISFFIVATVLYFFVVRPVASLMSLYKPKVVEVAPTSRDCPYCLQSVPLAATRCAYCTSNLAPPETVDATTGQSVSPGL